MSFPVAGYGEPFSHACKIGLEGQKRTVFVGGFIDRIDRTDQGIPGNRLQNRSRYDGFQNYRFGFRSGKSYPE